MSNRKKSTESLADSVGKVRGSGEQEIVDTDDQDLSLSEEYSPEMDGEELENYIEDISESVRIGLDQSIAILTPWFFNNMPKIYYQTVPRAEKVRHLSTVITGHVFETKQTVELWDRDRNKVTYIGPGGDRKILIDMASKLKSFEVKMGSLYFSRDSLLFLSTFFRKGFKVVEKTNTRNMTKLVEAKKLMLKDFPEEEKAIDDYLDNLDNDFVIYATAKRIQITYRMVHHMSYHEGAHTILEPFKNSPAARLTVGIKEVEITDVLELVMQMISRYGFDIVRAFVISFDRTSNEQISVMHFILRSQSKSQIDEDVIEVKKLIKALRTLGWVDSDDYARLTSEPWLYSISAANLIRSIASWVHVLLGKENPYYYSEYKIRTTFFQYDKLTRNLVELFRVKFDPLRAEARKNDGYAKDRQNVMKEIEEIIDPVERHIFLESLKFIDHILKTNYFLPTKTGFAFRLSPDILDPKHYPAKPFGIFFITGRDYRFFQIRWKDISRGGLRVVMPRSTSDYGFALAGIFDEVYGLSHAQQLKNKDIPEGGSKGVLLLRPQGNKSRAVRGAINALLDLLVSSDETHIERISKQISYYHDEEIIYLGPDENMTNDLIVWVPEQAERRGYKYAQAFMSSKPNAGINHKQYGVTSEGLHVFLDHTLRFLGINPKEQKFSIKLTGGPDGDVAGNELKILHREYGENAQVVAIADGFGAAFDPHGLNWQEILRLVEEGRSICHFDPKKLSDHKDSFVILADTTDNIRKRNQLHATVTADIFIPAGGRPYTVNDKNWNKFITETGDPSCRAIIEGANIFFTQEARERLQDLGIIMIKDSSANKTGVICSSYEIIASLLLSPEEFTAIKEEYVAQVIEILRKKAGDEARVLFAEHATSGQKRKLVDLSMDISKEINDVTDILLSEFVKNKDQILNDPIFANTISAHCPKILQERYGDRINTLLPEPHRIAILAASIASYIVYREGLGWLPSIAKEDRYQAVLTYIRQDQFSHRLVSEVENSNLTDRGSIAAILKMSATRGLTMLELKDKAQGK
jgi:glutamate dehydrogenase